MFFNFLIYLFCSLNNILLFIMIIGINSEREKYCKYNDNYLTFSKNAFKKIKLDKVEQDFFDELIENVEWEKL